VTHKSAWWEWGPRADPDHHEITVMIERKSQT
jgi:hypothetical protein